MRKIGFLIAMALLALVLASELAHAIAARLHVGDGATGPCSVIALGYPANDDGTVSSIEVERIDAAVHALGEYRCSSMIISGGAAHNGSVEADVMAVQAQRMGVAGERLRLERQSRDTKENIALSLPLIAAGENLFVVSNALHAQRARRYYCAARPADCTRTYIVPTAQTFSRLPQRLVESIHETISFLRDSIG